jgi:RNA polymerase sigma-70 factor (ECF subfamily)
VAGDIELLDAWAGGDERSGRDFYGRYAGRVVRFFARKIGDDPSDLVQRTFLKCLAARKEGPAVGDPAALLFAIARNELYDHLRRRMRDAARFAPETTSLEDTGAGPSRQVARAEEQRLLLEALRRVPLDDQLALELFYWEELSMESVARVLGVTKSAAINRVHRARQAVRDRLRAMEGAAAPRTPVTDEGFETWARSLKDGW